MHVDETGTILREMMCIKDSVGPWRHWPFLVLDSRSTRRTVIFKAADFIRQRRGMSSTEEEEEEEHTAPFRTNHALGLDFSEMQEPAMQEPAFHVERQPQPLAPPRGPYESHRQSRAKRLHADDRPVPSVKRKLVRRDGDRSGGSRLSASSGMLSSSSSSSSGIRERHLPSRTLPQRGARDHAVALALDQDEGRDINLLLKSSAASSKRRGDGRQNTGGAADASAVAAAQRSVTNKLTSPAPQPKMKRKRGTSLLPEVTPVAAPPLLSRHQLLRNGATTAATISPAATAAATAAAAIEAEAVMAMGASATPSPTSLTTMVQNPAQQRKPRKKIARARQRRQLEEDDEEVDARSAETSAPPVTGDRGTAKPRVAPLQSAGASRRGRSASRGRQKKPLLVADPFAFGAESQTDDDDAGDNDDDDGGTPAFAAIAQRGDRLVIDGADGEEDTTEEDEEMDELRPVAARMYRQRGAKDHTFAAQLGKEQK